MTIPPTLNQTFGTTGTPKILHLGIRSPKTLCGWIVSVLFIGLYLGVPSAACAYLAQTCTVSSKGLDEGLGSQLIWVDWNAHSNFRRSYIELQSTLPDQTLSDPEEWRPTPRDDEPSQELYSSVPKKKCTRVLDETDPKHEICSDVVDTPISTGPTLFTVYQAKQRANAIFENLNQFYRAVEEEQQLLELNRRGAESSSHAPSPDKGHLSDVITLQPLLSPQAAISHYFGMAPQPINVGFLRLRRQGGFQGITCQIVTDGGERCERLPMDVPHAQLDCYRSIVGTLPETLLRLQKDPFIDDSIEHYLFPSVHRLKHQNIADIARPPPKWNRIT